jgi:hypothetical protein
MEFGAVLAHYNGAGVHNLVAKSLYAKPLAG